MSTFICLKLGDTLILGTDSRFMNPDFTVIRSDSGRKIFEIKPGMFIAPVGWNTTSDFQVERARELASSTADLRIIGEALAQESIPVVQESAKAVLREIPHVYERVRDGEFPMHATVLVGRTPGGELGYILQIYRLQAGRAVCESNEYFETKGRLYCSTTFVAQQIVDEDPTILDGGPVEIVQKLLAALRRRVPTIGGEDQIVRIDGSGAHWISPIPAEAIAVGITHAAVTAAKMAANAITAANGALAASSVVDGNVVTVGINKVTYGTAIFAGDVVISRGVSLPVIVLASTGLTLFGQADASTGASGLTSHAYVNIASTGILVHSGASPSVLVNSTAVTVYSVNGNTSYPYTTVASGGILVHSGGNPALSVGSGGVVSYSVNGNTAYPYTSISSSGVLVHSGGNPAVTIGSGGVTVYSVNGNTSYPYVAVTSGGVTIVGGILTTPTITITSGTTTINLDGTNKLKISDSAGLTITADNYGLGVAGIGSSVSCSVTNIGFSVIGPSGNSSLNDGALYMRNVQVLSTRQGGPGTPSGFADSVAQTWCQNLYNALKPTGHGLVT